MSTFQVRRLVQSLPLLLALWPSQAQAFCRSRSCEPSAGATSSTSDDVACKKVDGCIVDGEELWRGSPCISFGIEKGTAKSIGFSDAEFEDIIAEAFSRWENVDCGDGQKPNLIVQSVGAVVTDGVYSCEKVPTENLGVWTLVSPWFDPECDETGKSKTVPRCREQSARGLTHTRFDRKVNLGEVLDSDVELNLERIAEVSGVDARRSIILSIATHEAGHYLGLSHSQNRNSTAVMAESYNDMELLLGKTMAQDDIDGICAVYPPANKPLRCSAPGYVEAALNPDACTAAAQALKDDRQEDTASCTVAAIGSHALPQGSSAWLAVFGGLALLRRRSR